MSDYEIHLLLRWAAAMLRNHGKERDQPLCSELREAAGDRANRYRASCVTAVASPPPDDTP